jgi:hypothetical protein
MYVFIAKRNVVSVNYAHLLEPQYKIFSVEKFAKQKLTSTSQKKEK